MGKKVVSIKWKNIREELKRTGLHQDYGGLCVSDRDFD